MKKFLSYLLALSVLVCCIAACSDKGRIIPRKTLSKIYAEMLLADQWLSSHPDARRAADTTFFYEPIFRKYGYSFKDYNATVDTYLEDPEKFLKIINATSEILKARKVEVIRLKDVEDGIRAANAAIKGYETKDFSSDSVRWAYNSILWPVRDSIPVAVDTLSVPDSLATQRDSLALADSLELPDPQVAKEIVTEKRLPKLDESNALEPWAMKEKSE